MTHDVLRMTANPFYAIEFSWDLFVEHEPIVTEDQWVAANITTIEEEGPEFFLRLLLDVLKGTEGLAP